MALDTARSRNFSWIDLMEAAKRLSWTAANLEVGHPIFEKVCELEDFIKEVKKEEESNDISIPSTKPA